jgi:hypothetical protein
MTANNFVNSTMTYPKNYLMTKGYFFAAGIAPYVGRDSIRLLNASKGMRNNNVAKSASLTEAIVCDLRKLGLFVRDSINFREAAALSAAIFTPLPPQETPLIDKRPQKA